MAQIIFCQSSDLPPLRFVWYIQRYFQNSEIAVTTAAFTVYIFIRTLFIKTLSLMLFQKKNTQRGLYMTKIPNCDCFNTK